MGISTRTTLTTPKKQDDQILASNDWNLVGLRQTTAGGVVIVSTERNPGPVAMGKGIVLDPNGGWTIFPVPPNQQVYIYSDSQESVSFWIVSMPFVVGNTLKLMDFIGAIAAKFGAAVGVPGRKC